MACCNLGPVNWHGLPGMIAPIILTSAAITAIVLISLSFLSAPTGLILLLHVSFAEAAVALGISTVAMKIMIIALCLFMVQLALWQSLTCYEMAEEEMRLTSEAVRLSNEESSIRERILRQHAQEMRLLEVVEVREEPPSYNDLFPEINSIKEEV